jgi:hypothetical protein
MEIRDMEGRITTDMDAGEILGMLRDADGYYLCNNERDVSQSDFKNRLMPMTTVRDHCTGGSSSRSNRVFFC